jgi:hypothetical protein
MSHSSKLVEQLIAAFPEKVTKLDLSPEQGAVLVEPVVVRDFFKYHLYRALMPSNTLK